MILRNRADSPALGLPAHTKAQDSFSLADPMPRVLTAVESDTFDDLADVKPLYADGSPLRNDSTEIIAS